MSFLEDTFGTADPVALASRTDAFKSAVTDALARPGSFIAKRGYAPSEDTVSHSIGEVLAKLDKTVGADVLASISAQLQSTMSGDINKEWTSSSPVSSGLVAYDLQAPAKFMVPVVTPIRNATPRSKGTGLAALYKQITGITNAGVGGVADKSPFFASESTTSSFGSLSLLRPPTISYAGADKSVKYVELGFSDQVSYKAQFAGVGFEDVKALSQTALLYSSMLGEEKAMLFGRGTSGNGYTGAIAAPTATAAAGVAGGITGTVYVRVTAKSGFGESVASTEVNTGAITSKNVVVSITDVAGALGYNVYASTTSGAEVYQGSTNSNTFTLSAIATGTAAVPGADTSADANAFDGLLTVQTSSVSGYVGRLNAALSTTAPGSEFQTAFAQLYSSSANGTVQADPDVVWIYGAGHAALSSAMLNSSSTGYRYEIGGAGGITIGDAVTGINNATTGKRVDIKVHPFLPNGTALILSESLPNVPSSNVANSREMRMVQDYMSIDWPQVQMSYDQSVYEMGTFVHYAPLWSGALVGIAN